jgi:hypothetical protein
MDQHNEHHCSEVLSANSNEKSPLEQATLELHSARASLDGRVFLWSPREVQRLRARGRLAVTPVGACGAKAATNGKAAAVPALLSDEELFACHVSGLLPPGSVRAPPPPDGPASAPRGAGAADVGSILGRALRREIELARARAAGGFCSGGQSQPPPPSALRRLVFLDLWRKGYSCTNGLKFGVDFLCYRGDPTAVHAAFMVIVASEADATGAAGPGSAVGTGLPHGRVLAGSAGETGLAGDAGSGIALLDLVARSRVATTALKICVMAWASPQIEEIGGADDGEAHLVGGSVRYAAFKRMGPGTAMFADAAAQQDGADRRSALGEEFFAAGANEQ